MQAVPLTGAAVDIVGALEIEHTEAGICVRRLPAWTRSQIPDQFMDLMVSTPAGVRLAFETDARAIELDALVTLLQLVGGQVTPAGFDLVVDGHLVDGCKTTEGSIMHIDLARRNAFVLEGGPAMTIRFPDLAPGVKEVEVWLPQSAMVELRALRVDDGAHVAAPAPDRRPRWIHYGSSISHCREASSPTRTWPAVAARAGGVSLLDLAFGGNCHLDPFVARTIRDLPADLISLKVGINILNMASMRERALRPALHGFLDTVRDGHPDTPVLVVSPVICPIGEEHPGPTLMDGRGGFFTVDQPPEISSGSLTLRRMREILSDAVADRCRLGDPNLHYLDGLGLFGTDDVVDLPDGLHPNAAGYLRIGERFAAAAFAPGAPLSRQRIS